MKQLEFNYEEAAAFLTADEIQELAPAVKRAHSQLHSGSGVGSGFLGWLRLPKAYGRAQVEKIKEAAQKIRQNAEVFIVIGIGGSYLGARAGLEMLSHSFSNFLPPGPRKGPQILFAGQALSGSYLQDLIDVIGERDFAINVISKSGMTIEPALAFGVLQRLLEARYGANGARSRIYATTDATEGALRALADKEGYTSFTIPGDIGGRYSVLTAVGLLPLAVAGLSIEEILKGAAYAQEWYNQAGLMDNAAYQYAAARNLLYQKGKAVEILINYEPSLQYFNEWWKQLFGESEGKGLQGIFPASVNFTTDLHSLGQFMQEGARNLFATTIWFDQPRRGYVLERGDLGLGELGYLAGMDWHYINEKAFRGTLAAHTEGGVPNLILRVPAWDPRYFGALVYFFQKACAISGYLFGVNPFDQPGVEAYKKKMYALLQKRGLPSEN